MTAHDQFTLHLDRGERYAFEVSLDWERVRRCFGLFEDYCVVTAGVRNGIPVSVVIVDPSGEELYRQEDEPREPA
jgi:hypothetical protein